MGTSPFPSRGPKRGRKCYVNPASSGVPSKGDKIQCRCVGGKDKTLDVESKENTTKNFSHKWGVCVSKNTLKTPPQTIFKGGGGSETHPRYRISQDPPPP